MASKSVVPLLASPLAGDDAACVGSEPSGNGRTGPAGPLGNATTDGVTGRYRLDEGPAVTLGESRP
jgi:hypothetical protein